MSSFRYPGTELGAFAHARNWKTYVRSFVASHLRGDVLEVGAGIGTTTAAFLDGSVRSWTALEPDERLAGQIRSRVSDGATPVEVIVGGLERIPAARHFDCILYIDVLEHIADDGGELGRAAGHLNDCGAIVALSPAHQFLFSEFDRAIGHRRRYDRRRLRAITPRTLRLVSCRYLDSVGLLLSAANRALLRSSQPSLAQIRIWDCAFVPVARHLDRLLRWRVGKSVLAVWTPAT